jgi:hypothetical protein
LYSNDKATVNDANGHPIWSWVGVIAHDIQTNRISRFVQAKEVKGGYKSNWNETADAYNKFLTVQAMQRLGTG